MESSRLWCKVLTLVKDLTGRMIRGVVLVVRMVRREKNIKRKYKLIAGAQHTNVADADSTRISEAVVQFKHCFRIK